LKKRFHPPEYFKATNFPGTTGW